MKVIQRVPQSNYFDLLFSISQSYPLLLLLAGDIATGASSSETITCCCCVSDLPTRCALAVIWIGWAVRLVWGYKQLQVQREREIL